MPTPPVFAFASSLRAGSYNRALLRQAFKFTNSYCMPEPELLVARAHEKFDGDGRLTDNSTRPYLRTYLAALEKWIARL